MKVEIIMNGKIKIVLLPENAIEEMTIKELSKGDLSTTEINQSTTILDKVITKGLVLTPINKSNSDEIKKES